MVSIHDYGLLAKAVYAADPAVPGWVCTRFRPSQGNSLQAAVFTRDKVTVVAFKGTTPSQSSDIVADLKLGIGMNTSYFSDAESFVAQHAGGAGVVVTGHSLGGAIAQTVGNRRRLPFVSFNAPGVALVASRNLPTATLPMTALRTVGGALSALRHPLQMLRDVRSAFHLSLGVNYRLSGDIVSAIGLHYGDIITLPGAGNPLEQHKMASMLEVLDRRGYRSRNFPD